MKITELAIPRTCAEMQQVFESYYYSFYLEMVRMSNSNLNAYVDSFIETLVVLSKNPPSSPNVIRAAMGIVALHRFGYHKFQVLANIFDRLLPQIDIEYVRFLSWCAGRLIHHPDIEQARYVTHLFDRCVGWSRAKGRRARPLAAACLLTALSTNAGSSVVVFFPTLQSIIWLLVSHQSTQVLRATADAIAMYTRAVVRYCRSDLEAYLDFLAKLCMKLLYFGAPLREYAALILFEQLINGCPDYFLSQMLNLYSAITDATADEPMLVYGASFVTIAALSQVDSKLFIDNIADDLFSKANIVLFEFPKEVVDSLALLCKTVPDFMETKLDELKEFATELVSEPDNDFTLLTAILNQFSERCLPIDEELIKKLITVPMTQNYLQFFVSLANTKDAMSLEIITLLIHRITNELHTDHPNVALNLLSMLPQHCLINPEKLLNEVMALSLSTSDYTRSISPRAIFSIAKKSETIKTDDILKKLIQLAIFDKSASVRSSILKVIQNNCSEQLASPEYIRKLQIFINDDAVTGRNTTFRILANIAKLNPLAVTSLTRNAVLDCFFYIRHAPNIRQRARYLETLPDIIKASASTIKAYSGGFMDIALTLLIQCNSPNQKYVNFMEEDAVNLILIGVMDSLSLLAPLDPKMVAHYGDVLIPIICDILLNRNYRLLSLSILQLFFTLLTAPGSDLSYRIKTPMIMSACSTFLAKTHSRKARMATLKVLGAIGVLEVHQKPPPTSCESPENIDDKLARQFFHPTRDSEGEIDDSLLLRDSTVEQYFASFAASSLLSIFRDENLKEFYVDVVQALVQVLHFPRMFMLIYFDSFVSRLLEVIEAADDDEIKEYLPLFTQLVENSTHNTSPFLKRSLAMIHNRFCNKLAIQFLDLILAFLYSIRDGFSPYASDTIQLLVTCLDECKTAKEQESKRCLSAFSILGVYAIELLYIIIPFICNAILCEQTLSGVRIAAIETLCELIKTVDTYQYLGPIIRAVTFGLYYEDQVTRNASYELLYTLFKSQGANFLNSSEPLIEALKKSNMITPYLETLIEEATKQAEAGGIIKFRPIAAPKRRPYYNPHDPSNRKHQYSEEAILAKIHTPTIGVGRHMEQWMRSLMLAIISNSPSDQIRACTTLATSHYPLALKLFNAAFLSCWMKTSENGRNTIVDAIKELLQANDNYESVMREILGLLVFMDKIEKPLNIAPEVIVSASIRYGGVAYALHIQQQLFEKHPDNAQVISTLIDIFVQLQDWPNAIGLWKKCQEKDPSLNKPEVLSRLRMWDQVEPTFRERFNRTKDFDSFYGLSQSLSAMAMWPQLINFIEVFKILRSHQKRAVSIFFSEAALHVGRWDILEETLKYSPDDSTRGNALKALNAIHKKDVKTVDECILRGFSLLASKPITFWADNQRVHPETMQAAQELVEISEMRSWLTGQADTADLDEVWNERLNTAPRDFDLWFHLIANRVRITDVRDDNLIKFFALKSATLGTKIHINAFELLFPEFNFDTAPDLHKICYVVAHWNIGEKHRALSEMEKLTHIVNEPLKSRCHFLYSSWLLENDEVSIDDLKKAYDHLRVVVQEFDEHPREQKSSFNRRYQQLTIDLNSPEVVKKVQQASENCGSLILPSQILKELTTDQMVVELMRKWSDVNASLISLDPSYLADYVTNAINALTTCAKLSPSFPDVVQLLNIFFEHANEEAIFHSTASFICELQPKLLIQATPQLLIQLSHQSEEVASFVHRTVLDLLNDHYHALIFSVIVMKKSTNKARGTAAKKILEEFSSNKPKVYAEVELIRKSMLMAAVTWNERVLQYITDAFDHFQRNRIDRMLASLASILELVKKPKCEMHHQFLNLFSKNMQSLDQILRIFNRRNKNSMAQLSQWCKNMQDLIGEELKRIRMIQLSSISHELCERTGFFMAVPGTYKPSKAVNHIMYFVGQLSVYMSKQQPKDVIVRGEDGNFYQYLLKGHEDLRLDERIMQFFRLINSLIMKASVFQQNMIQTMGVIPLSLQHGLVQWVPGTETLRAVVEQMRKLHNRDPMEEYNLSENYSDVSIDLLMPVQKMQIIKKIFQEVPDTDISDFFWLKAANAEMWMKQTRTFAISSGMTSIVGYIIGLGDRHPSNLLIDRFTGKVIHIDFGDCFERASRRVLLPEVVPFRLTRMMAKAMGPTGVDGNFRTSFVNMSQLLRENKRVLVMVLSTFVHEPLIDPDIEEDKKAAKNAPQAIVMKGKTESFAGKSFHPAEEAGIQSSVEMRKRVIQKLTGNDFGDESKLSIEDQATLLIKTATDPYVLSRMYSGWCPFW
ncbi:PIKK family atypical protein kinase [Tritrichomonas foetus]|uniref:Serine/threonine-protein kinase TOR n=1 Tax=Tritrichomonas foetus TaxID=1144522 RepID=A0A1J4JBE1_9EUKA|nr:PIKK family atypical protein kinase [Tritrichomonas foetus]|eukprot:OHS94749.1 PIKK family atypical protein kinase [Tritrichomonas foetus]